MVKAALSHKYDPALHQNLRLQLMILNPLQEMSTIMHPDIRQKQLECIFQILHSNGDTLNDGWPCILGVIGAVSNHQGEKLVQTAFQSLQLVVTDFLPVIPCKYLQISVKVAAKFGLQHQELNISLTAIGLLWNIADYFHQNRQRIKTELDNSGLTEEEKVHLGMSPFDALWMCLFTKLGELCVDQRPAVRKSAGQTLFSTISAHGTLLQQETWKKVLWQVLFPLLENVQKLSSAAPTTKDESVGGNILIHHSRDTAEKQWAETRVLTLAGVARTFHTQRKILQCIGDFPRAWSLLLEHIENSALCQNAEVSLAALKSFQEILHLNKESKDDSSFPLPELHNIAPPSVVSIDRLGESKDQSSNVKSLKMEDTATKDTDVDYDVSLWSSAWKVWLNIGTNATKPPENSDQRKVYVPSQPFLTALVQTVPPLFEHIKMRFVATDLKKLSFVLNSALSVPVQGDASPFIIPSYPEITTTPLQDATLEVVETLIEAVISGPEGMQTMYADIFDLLLTYIEYGVKAPRFGRMETKMFGTVKGPQVDWVTMNFIPFAEKCVELAVDMYKRAASHLTVIQAHVLQKIIKSSPTANNIDPDLLLHNALADQNLCCLFYRLLLANCIDPDLPVHYSVADLALCSVQLDFTYKQVYMTFRQPLGLKYGCPSQTTWQLVISAFLTVLSVGLPVARKQESTFQNMWSELAQCLEDFLFSKHPSPPTLSIEDFQRDEAIDCQVIQMIRDDILPYAGSMPKEFVVKIMQILNKGSIHSTTSDTFVDTDSSRKLREEFAKSCFETLLQFSFVNKSKSEEYPITKLAVLSLLQRCQEVVKKYVEDERLSGKCPLPRPRLAEMASVLKAVTTLISSLKKAPPGNVEMSVWNQVIQLYPSLVDCTTSPSPSVCKALREALREYKDLLAPPSTALPNGR